MKSAAKKKLYKRIPLALSLLSILCWLLMGSGASVAWFSDTSTEVRNVFHMAEFKVALSYRPADGTEYLPVDGGTKVFDDEALYEPGYVQVVYLKVDNVGTRAFDFKTAVTVTDYTVATNVYGRSFSLQDFLRFGLAAASTEEELTAMLATRGAAESLATLKLSNYASDSAQLAPGDSAYLALIVRMPKGVGNAANYRGVVIPKVNLGLIVTATQIME